MSVEAPVSLRCPKEAGDPIIVAVACFVDDIAAPSELVAALSSACELALYFVQQPAESCGRRLAEGLGSRTSLPVTEVRDGARAEHGHIYLIPPNCVPTMTDRRVRLLPATDKTVCPADVLFTSLALEMGGQSVGVILSGGGSELASGIRAIRQAGGTTFAQYPGSARFPSLPISAIDTGCVDFVLRPNEIAQQLTHIDRRMGAGSPVAPTAGPRQWPLRQLEVAKGLADPGR